MKIIDSEDFTFTEENMDNAMRKACEHINKILLVKTEQEEYSMFKEFYEIVLKEINYPNINNDLRKHFSTFVMSSVYGSYKSEKILFKIAIEELGIKPEEAMFIDDSESNLKAAEEFGMIPILIDVYNSQELISKYPIIHSINELIEK